MRWAVALLSCGCNQVLGLPATELSDGRSPPACPPLGGVPTFYGDLLEVPARYCHRYVPSSDGKVALTVKGNNTLMHGMVDRAPAPITLVPPPPDSVSFTIMPMPEGDRMLLLVRNAMTAGGTATEYTVQGDIAQGGTAYAIQAVDNLGTPSAGPDRRIVFQEYASVVEIADSGAGWTEVRRYPIAELGSVSIQRASLSSDGLRFVFLSQAVVNNTSFNAVYYTDRATTSDHFGPARLVDTAPASVEDPYLTANCGRLYFSALDTVFYLQ